MFSYTGKRFFLICWCQREKIIAFRYKIEPKIDTFGQGDTRVFANVWVEKKNRILDFFKVILELFRKCVGIGFRPVGVNCKRLRVNFRPLKVDC